MKRRPAKFHWVHFGCQVQCQKGSHNSSNPVKKKNTNSAGKFLCIYLERFFQCLQFGCSDIEPKGISYQIKSSDTWRAVPSLNVAFNLGGAILSS